MIKILLLNNIHGQLVGEISPELKKKLVQYCSYEVKGSFFAPQVQMGTWDGRKNLISTITWKFPLGLFARIRFALNESQIPFEVEDRRVNPGLGIHPIDLKGIQLRPYQEKAITTARTRDRGVIKAATGAGKSMIMAGLIQTFGPDATINVYVNRNTLLRQLEKTFKDVGIKGVGIIGDGVKEPNRVTICSVASLAKVKEEDNITQLCEINKAVMNAAQVSIWDECHHLPSTSFQIISQYSKNSFYRYGFTATPYREDNAEILIEAVTGRLVSDLGASAMIKDGWLVPPHIYFVDVPAIPGFEKRDGYAKIYQEGITENDHRNEMIANIVKNCYMQNKSCIVAVSKIKHGEILLEKISKLIPENKVAFIQGAGTSGEEKMQALKDLHERRVMCVIATTVFGEGVDVQSLDVLINTKAASSSIDTFQLCGRALRPFKGKTHATIIDFYDRTMPYLGSHARTRMKILSLESEFIIKRVNYAMEILL